MIDSHCHLLPERLQRRIRDFFAIHLPGDLAYPADHGEVRDRLAAEGITEVWSLPYAHRPGVAEGMNQSMAVIAAGEGGVRVVGGCTVHPGDEDPVGVVRRAVEDLGLRVLKLHCSVGEYRPDDARLDSVWDYAASVRLPVVLHAGHAVSGHTEADELAPVELVAVRHPEARIVIAHCGHRAVDTALDLVERHANVHADLTPVVDEPVALSAARAARLAHRLLLGSDAPNTARTVSEGVAQLRSLGLTAAALAAITGGNAERLQAGVRS